MSLLPVVVRGMQAMQAIGTATDWSEQWHKNWFTSSSDHTRRMHYILAPETLSPGFGLEGVMYRRERLEGLGWSERMGETRRMRDSSSHP